jgi:hypothetical protein
LTSYERSLPREARKARGVFYTPDWIVDRIVSSVVRPGDTVLDPACGAGAFLQAALRITPHVTGIDTDADALRLAAGNAPGATLIHADGLTHDCATYDVVIGNPPYLSIDDYGLNTPELRARFKHVYRDKTDLAYYFLARAVELARRSIGFIVSRAFLEAYKADNLRRFLTAHTVIREIVEFNDRIFADAGVATCIVILDKREGTPSPAPWIIVPDPVRHLHAKIDSAGTPVGEILVVGQGMQTGRNNVFGGFTSGDPSFYRKRARNSDIQAFSIRDRGEHILYLEHVAEFGQLPPGIQRHLLAHRAELESRAAYRRGDCEWWKYTWPLHKELYGRPRMLCPYLAATNRFAIDSHNEFLSLTDTTVLFDNGQPEDLRYIAALLNSRLLTWRFRTIGKLKGQGQREYFWNSVSRLPIRRSSDPYTPLDDQAVYKLYDLTESEIALVDS